MKIRMLETRRGAANALGSRTRLYRLGESYAMSKPWQEALAAVFVMAGWARPARKPARAGSGKSARSRQQ